MGIFDFLKGGKRHEQLTTDSVEVDPPKERLPIQPFGNRLLYVGLSRNVPYAYHDYFDEVYAEDYQRAEVILEPTKEEPFTFTNQGTIRFKRAESDWGRVAGVGLFDPQGMLLAANTWTTATKIINEGDTILIPPGSLVISLSKWPLADQYFAP